MDFRESCTPSSGRRLKVAIIASWYPTYAQEGIFVKEQADALARVHDIAVIAPRCVGWGSALLRGLWNPRFSMVRTNDVLTLHERHFNLVPRCPLGWRMPFVGRTIGRAFRRLCAQWGRPDILHAHVVVPGGYAAVQLGRANNLPVVLTEHWSEFLGEIPAGRKRLYRDTLRQCNRILAVSPALAARLQELVPENPVTAVGNLVRTDFFTIRSVPRNDQRIRFFSVGDVRACKGAGYLVEATRILRDKGVEGFEVLVGGEGEDRLSLEQRTKDLGLTAHCRFLGRLSRERVRDQMQACDVFVLPSLVETFSIATAEAMACGKPVIATRCGGPEFVVTPGAGIFVDPGDPAALAEAMERFIVGKVSCDPSLTRASIVDRFSEGPFVDQTTRIYEEVLRCYSGRTT